MLAEPAVIVYSDGNLGQVFMLAGHAYFVMGLVYYYLLFFIKIWSSENLVLSILSMLLELQQAADINKALIIIIIGYN